jgi:hypothetical protein
MSIPNTGIIGSKFTPNKVSGLIAWLDASETSTITESGGLVSDWRSKHNGASIATAATTARPTLTAAALNGRSALTFNGSANVMAANSLSSLFNGTDLPFSFFSVIKRAATGVSHCILCGENTADYAAARNLIHAETTDAIYFRRRDNGAVEKSAFGGTTTTAACTVFVTFSGTQSNFYINGTLVGSANQDSDVGAITCNKVSIGAFGSTPGAFFNGLIAEIILVNRVVTTAERTSIQSYFKGRWGL